MFWAFATEHWLIVAILAFALINAIRDIGVEFTKSLTARAIAREKAALSNAQGGKMAPWTKESVDGPVVDADFESK